MTTMDRHHPAGKANNPNTISVLVNDHWAELNEAQEHWPKDTLENPDGDPVLALAANARAILDMITYLVKKFLSWIPEALESLARFLLETLGRRWWIGTPLERFAPKR
jgi:hypothetical protein